MATNQAYRSDRASVNEALIDGTGPVQGGAAPTSLLLQLKLSGISVCGIRLECATAPGFAWFPQSTMSPAQAGVVARRFAASDTGAQALIIVLALQPTAGMDRVGDEVTPIVMAEGVPANLFPTNGPMHALTSDTTRYPGLVANVDVAPTILSFFHVPIPSSMSGSPMRVTRAPAPFSLDRRQIQYRAVRTPVQITEGILVSAAGLAVILGLFVLDRRGRISKRASLAWRSLVLVVVALPIPLALGGLLPSFTFATVTAWIVLWAVLLAVLALVVRRDDPLFALTFLGIVGLVVLVVDLLLGAHGLRIPLLGGTMFLMRM